MISRLSENGASRNLVGFNSGINAQVGSYTVTLEDLGKIVEVNSSASVVVTVPTDANAPFQIGDRVDILQTGAGQITVAGDTGVTISSEGSKTKLKGQWAAATVIKRGANSWVLIGNIFA